MFESANRFCRRAFLALARHCSRVHTSDVTHDEYDQRAAVMRRLTGVKVSVACLALNADIPAGELRMLLDHLCLAGRLRQMTGRCDLCGGTSVVYTGTAS